MFSKAAKNQLDKFLKEAAAQAAAAEEERTGVKRAADAPELRATPELAAAGQVEQDLSRTFPRLAFFAPGSPMRAQLRRVLLAYALHRPDHGYVQGLSHLAAVLLLIVGPLAPLAGEELGGGSSGGQAAPGEPLSPQALAAAASRALASPTPAAAAPAPAPLPQPVAAPAEVSPPPTAKPSLWPHLAPPPPPAPPSAEGPILYLPPSMRRAASASSLGGGTASSSSSSSSAAAAAAASPNARHQAFSPSAAAGGASAPSSAAASRRASVTAVASSARRGVGGDDDEAALAALRPGVGTSAESLAFRALVALVGHLSPVRWLLERDTQRFDRWCALYSRVLRRLRPAGAALLETHGVAPRLYVLPWVMTLFTRPLGLEPAIRLWDRCVLGGAPELLRAAVGLAMHLLPAVERLGQGAVLEFPFEAAVAALARPPAAARDEFALLPAVDGVELTAAERDSLRALEAEGGAG